MSDFLVLMAESSAARAAAVTRNFTDSDFDAPLVPLHADDFGVIAEIKDRSPAEGELATEDSNRVEQAQAYARGGAMAISVLTEPDRFAGSLEHVGEVVDACPSVPVMRKDFLVDPVQVLEARAAGASGVLLIATLLDDDQLRAMLDCCYEHGMFVLLESFDEWDLRRSRELMENAKDLDNADTGRLMFGVNTRNLRTLDVDRERLEKMAAYLPKGICVAESGLHTAEDAARVAILGYRAALVGTALMRSDDPESLLRAMQKAGASAV
ncbi:MAG: indole-3-glycerol-phosphate synthase [Woeseiaceae bacterium]|nr:indole-3-glycerol-phosphate synthase [Woeseiaceae bacterium]